MDTYGSEGLSETFCLYCFCIVYAVVLKSHENRLLKVLFPGFVINLFLKFIIKSLIHYKLVNFFLAVGFPSLAHSKNINFMRRECSNFEGDEWDMYRDM